MALPDTIEDYSRILRSLLAETESVVIRGRLMRESFPSYSGEQPEETLMRHGFSPEEAQQPFTRLTVAAERYLETSDALQQELELEQAESGADERLAALMGGHWLAATGLTLAAESSLETTPQAGINSLRRVLTMQFPGPEDLFQRLVESDVPAAEVVLSYAHDQEVANVEAGLLGQPPVRGGAASPQDLASARITRGLVSSANSIVTNMAAGSVLGPLLSSAASSFVRGGFGQIARGAALGIGRIRQAALRVVQRAVEIARKFIGNEPVDRIESWIHTHVMGLAVNVELKIVRKVLKADELDRACQAVLDTLSPPATKARLARLDQVAADYGRWSKWGTNGARFLAMVPTAALGPAGPPVVAMAVVALLAYEVWTAWDHLDWPSWPLPRRALGVAAVLGVTAP